MADCAVLAARPGWASGPAGTHHVVGNGTSAFKRKRFTLPGGRRELRTVRPAFRQALARLADGRADDLVAQGLDRAVRDPRDLVDLTGVAGSRLPRVGVRSVTGSPRLDGGGNVILAGVLTAVAGKSSRDTARRVAGARQRRATAVRLRA